MKNAIWTKAIQSSADPQRAQHYLELLGATSANKTLADASTEQARILTALFSGSQALSNWLVADPEALSLLSPEPLQHPRRQQGLRREVASWFEATFEKRDYAEALKQLRRFKQREMLRIGARDLARLAGVAEITGELSTLADVCLNSVWRICMAQAIERFGHPRHQDADGHWLATEACVLGLGKLGGQELNYSSDVDVIFIYAGEGQASKAAPAKNKTPTGGVTNHQFFNRVAELFIAEIGRNSADGMFYRIDLRLRPEGDSGPLARSLDSFENYYSQWGQTWERMMLIKARCVAGDAVLASEFLDMVQPFRYPRSLGEGVLREISAMKDRIENEVVKAGELDRNVKLGRGGIREIEFIAQTLQLLNAGRSPFLQGSQTMPMLAKLVDYKLISATDAKLLTEAYVFFRDVEHRLQMEDNLQTHTIPISSVSRERLARLMAFTDWKTFSASRQRHADAVRAIFDRLLRPDSKSKADGLPMDFTGSEAAWKKILAEHRFRNVDHSFRLLTEFANGPGYVHVSSRTAELARQLLPRFFALCPAPGTKAARVLSDPDRVLTRLDSFITAYGARATLFESWNNNPSIFELLLLLFDRSEFLAEVAIHTPDLVDDLVTSGRLRQQKNSTEILEDLRHGLDDADQRLWLRRYHQAEQMRIALRDILGLAPVGQNLAELSALADACLQYALEVTLRKNKIKQSPLAVIGLGKIGGAEINYGSDLDITFVTDARVKDLPKLQPLAIALIDLLSSRTEQGTVFIIDARLRPDGEKGLLVNTIDAYEAYYRQRAQLWEIQSLSRSRAIAGDPDLGKRFLQLAKKLTDFTGANVENDFFTTASGNKRAADNQKGLVAYAPDWRSAIVHMRQRIEKERTPAGKDALAIKTGAGGLMDAEFVAQIFSLANGWQEPNTLEALIRARDGNKIRRADADRLIDNYCALRSIENILRRWSFEGETLLPEEKEPFYRVAIRCGFTNAKDFRQALIKYRSAIRAIYKKAVCA